MEPLLLSCIESRVENSRNFYGRFQLGPFVLGQAITIANSLRRSLLSEISGLAITAVEIEGVAHEYSTIEGIRESVLDILLNIKQIVLTSDFQIQEPQVAFLQVQGPGIVRAKDIKLPISIQSVDPEQYIATLLYDGLLKMKFMICRGKNYLVQTPLGLKIPNSPPPSYKKQEDPFFELNAEIYLTKSFNTLTSHTDKSSICKPNTPKGMFGLQIEDLSVKKVICQHRFSHPKGYKVQAQKVGVKSKKQSVNFNPFLSKKSNESSFVSFLQIEDLQDHQQEEKSAALPHHKSHTVTSLPPKGEKVMLESYVKGAGEMSESNSDVTIDLSNNNENEKKISPIYSTSSEETLLNNNKAELSSLPISEKKNTIDSKIPQKQKKKFKKISNILPIDAVFMPINRVNFAIELNNESEAPKDLVILEIWTNGSIHPKQAINEAAKALIQLITPFQETKNFKSVFINSPKVLQRSLSSSNIETSPSNVTTIETSHTDKSVTNLCVPSVGGKEAKNIPNIPCVLPPKGERKEQIPLGCKGCQAQQIFDLLTHYITAFTSPPCSKKEATPSNTLKGVRAMMLEGGESDVRSKVRICKRSDVKKVICFFLRTQKGDVSNVSMLEGDGSTTLKNINLPESFSRTKKNIKLLPHLPAKGQVIIAKQETARGKHRNSLLNKNIASLDIGNLDLSLRPYTCLKRAKIETVADLLSYSAEDLLNLKNFGKRSLDQIEQNLNQMGLKLHS